MKILAGAAVRQDPEVLAAHIETMKWQTADAQVDLCYVIDQDPDEPGYSEVVDLLTSDPDIQTILTDVASRPAGAEYVRGEDTHSWTIPTFEHLARLKQLLLDKAVADGYDAVWLVDTDLLCDPGTLSSLISVDAPVVSAVFWTRWSPGGPPQPQVWLRHPYELSNARYSEHKFLSLLHRRNIVRVLGLGACTLIKTEVLDRLKYWPFLPGLPTHGMWQGEDRHFSLRANRQHIPLIADAWPDIYHIYRPSDKANIPAALSLLRGHGKRVATIGDFVSFQLENLSDPRFADHALNIRGRLGQLDLLPEIEQDLLDLEPSQSILSTITFPPHYPLESYQNTTHTFRITLLAVKPYIPHIGLPTVESDFENRLYHPAHISIMRDTSVDYANHNQTPTDAD
jgi:hypothetical protein